MAVAPRAALTLMSRLKQRGFRPRPSGCGLRGTEFFGAVLEDVGPRFTTMLTRDGTVSFGGGRGGDCIV